MMLREDLKRRLLEDRGITPQEACDKCGQVLGALRYTSKDEPGVWCSSECRGSSEHSRARKRVEP